MTATHPFSDALAIEPIYIKLGVHLYLNIMRQWQVSPTDVAAIAKIDLDTLHAWQHNAVTPFDLDIYLRITLIIEINKGLKHLYINPSKVGKWMQTPIAAFKGHSPLNHIIKHGLTGLYDVNAHCRYLAFIKPEVTILH